MFVKRY